MRIDTADTAMAGYDGRVIYTDTLTVRLYDLLTDGARADVRRMLTSDWSGSRDIGPSDLTDPTGIAAATIRISDCVARSRIEFGPSLSEADRVIAENNEITIRQTLPDTVVATLKGRSAGDVFGHGLLRNIRITHVRSPRNPLVLLWNDPTRMFEGR